jgi:hypothetical protein
MLKLAVSVTAGQFVHVQCCVRNGRPCSPTPVAGCAGRCTCWTYYCTQRAFWSLRQAYAASYDENLVADVMVFVVFNIVSHRTINPWIWVLLRGTDLKQIWIFPYPYRFCNPVRIHGMTINDMRTNEVPFRFLCVLQFVYVRVRAWVGVLVVVVVWGSSGATCWSCVDTSKWHRVVVSSSSSSSNGGGSSRVCDVAT